MSRIGKQPIPIPEKVKVTLTGDVVHVEGPKGKISKLFAPVVKVTVADKVVTVSPTDDDSRFAKAMYGTVRSVIAGMVKGASEGYVKDLEIQGVGFKAAAQGKKLNLSLGFSHDVVYDIPAGIEVKTPTAVQIEISGADRQKVGQVAAEIRSYKPPEPYKGKGVRYSDETVALKEVKKK